MASFGDFTKSLSGAIGGAAGDAKAAAGSKREALLQAAQAAKDQARQLTDQSKVYLDKVVDKVGTYATQATDRATHKIESLQTHAQTQYQGIKENYDKARAAGHAAPSGSAPEGSTDRGLPTTETEEIKFPYNLVTWCTSVCGRKDGPAPAAGGLPREFSVDSIQSTLHELETASQQAQAAAVAAKEKAAAAVTAEAAAVQAQVEEEKEKLLASASN